MKRGIIFDVNCFTQRIVHRSLLARNISKMSENNVTETNDLKDEEEQIVNIETVVAKDNKGINYMKLISKNIFYFNCCSEDVNMWCVFYFSIEYAIFS